GSIPGLGALFRSRKTDKVKTNLLVFIRPKILRDSVSVSRETNEKYNYIRDVLKQSEGSGIQLMPKEDHFSLPPFEEADKSVQDAEEDGQ
ncbi:MAG: type II secretion system secretin GspD, partial [Woeseiaceae bacterium]